MAPRRGERGRLLLCTISGIFTAPNFLDEFGAFLHKRCAELGFKVSGVQHVMPYGDWTAAALKQSAEVAADLFLPAFGGKRTVLALKPLLPFDGEIALIGHSGGGLAAVHAAYDLARSGAFIRAVVMIGSPKRPIPQFLRPVTAHLSAKGSGSRFPGDAVARIGSFLGRRPALVRRVNIVGGHRDYFRSRPPFIGQDGASNLEVTAANVSDWILMSPGAGLKPETNLRS